MLDVGAPEKPPEPDKAAVLFVSLYMLLLAFFILLNSVSERQPKRVEQVMGSLQATFRGQPAASWGKGQVAVVTDESYVRLVQIFRSELPLARPQASKAGKVMRFVAPTDAVFEKSSSRIRINLRPVLKGISAALKYPEQGMRREVEFIVGVRRRPTNGRPETDLAIARAAAMAEAMRTGGTAPERIHTGIRPAARDVVAFTFFVRPEQASKLDFVSDSVFGEDRR